MPSTRDIRRRIKSVKNTAQITKAMQLVAAAKMKKAQDQATNGRPFADAMNQVLVSLRNNVGEAIHPFLFPGKGSKVLAVIIATDKGLCGSLNANLIKKTISTITEPDVDYVTIGRKAAQAISRLRRNLVAEFSLKDPAVFAEVRRIGKLVQEKFLTGEYSKVVVVFNNFINTVTIEPTVEQLLPVEQVTLGSKRGYEGMGSVFQVTEAKAPALEYTFEPTAAHVFDAVLPYYVNLTLFQMLLESRASEHSSRMVAMKNATDNAMQMIKDLTLDYNKVRQAAITNELLEITTAKMALA